MQALTLFPSLFLTIYLCYGVDIENVTVGDLLEEVRELKTYVTLQDEKIELLERKIYWQRREIRSLKEAVKRKMFLENEDEGLSKNIERDSQSSISGAGSVTRGWCNTFRSFVH